MPEELTLLPCPACGEKADIIDEFERDDKGHVAIGWSAYCTRGCLTTSEHGSREKAAASWNTCPAYFRGLHWHNLLKTLITLCNALENVDPQIAEIGTRVYERAA
jgi:hypothetical protein